MYYFVQMMRAPIYEGTLPSASIIQTGAVIAISTLVIGWIIFSTKSDEFAYRT
jgi:ABC-type polysaccharide/polyol phosphate export permease